MADSLAAPVAGVALAAGLGTRLHPLTLLRPKALCPVGDRALLDWALDALRAAVDGPAGTTVAVNAHHRWSMIESHLAGTGVHLSVEQPEPLGTAGAIGRLRSWLDGRGALVVNADTWHRADLGRFVADWDGEGVRVLTSTPLPFGPRSSVVASILPWERAVTLDERPSGLWETVWRAAVAAGTLDAVHHEGPVVDCATPADYLRANMVWSGGRSVVGDAVLVAGQLERCVVWPGATVDAGEHLVDAIRADGRTVLVR